MSRRVLVHHEGANYAVLIGHGVRNDLEALLAERHPAARIAVITDSRVASLLGPLRGDVQQFTFEPGEMFKTRATWSALTDQLLAAGFDRHTVIVAQGGGVVTDMAGFVAATFLRGVPWVAIPTTTLGMLDAAVGGKTGVDTPAGKNLVGAFHPPSAVLCDTDTLRTLPDRTFREGIAEAVKHGATLDARYGEWMQWQADRILARDRDALEELISRSVELKAGVVMSDPHEGDRRAVLNAGHTVAHGLELGTDYLMPHGEAVAIGLVLETLVAERAGIAEAGTAERIAALAAAFGLPVSVPAGVDRVAAIAAMQSDKKNRGGVIHAALVARFGAMAGEANRWTVPFDIALLSSVW